MDKRQETRRLNHKGFTLIEVLAAFVILIICSQTLLIGIRFAAKMGDRAAEMEQERREIGQHLMDRSDCIYGTVRLDMDGVSEDIVSEGWLYTGEYNEDSSTSFAVIWVDE